jgi:polygalacturonase
MSRIVSVLPLSCWLLVCACSTGSGSRVNPVDASGGNPDVSAAPAGAAGNSAPGTGGVQGTGGDAATGGSSAMGGTDSGAGGLAATGGAVPVDAALAGGSQTRGGTSAGGTATNGGAQTTGGAAGGATVSGGAANAGGATASAGTPAGGSSGNCGDGDPNMPSEPTIPAACATLLATQNVAPGGVPSEASLDTSTIQTALTACKSGQAVKLTTGGANNAFITGPLTIPSGVTLWVDAGTTLYATRDTKVWGAATQLILVSGSNSGIVGDGVIDGQGGEPNIGSSQSWWDQNAGSSGNSPALIAVKGATKFSLYRITLHNSPKFHVKLDAAGFVVWGVTIKAPSKASNSAGTALTYSNAHNTDGIDPGEAASDGTIVCSNISTGDDHIAIKGSSSTGVKRLVIAHNHFGAGHGMSIGSEFTGGVSDINVYDLSIDGLNMGTSGGSSNGIRIKSDSSRGGLVNNVTYSDVCVRNLSNPILLTPTYSTATGAFIPQYTNIKIQNFHDVSGGSNTPQVTLDGYDAAHMNSITLDNVIIDGISAANVTASYTNVTLGPGNVNFLPSGTNVTTNSIAGSSTPNPCTDKWVTF